MRVTAVMVCLLLAGCDRPLDRPLSNAEIEAKTTECQQHGLGVNWLPTWGRPTDVWCVP